MMLPDRQSRMQDSVNWNIRDDLKGKSLEHIKNSRTSLPFAIGLINVKGELNIGMSIRTAEIFGAESAWVIGKKRFDLRSTVGSQNYINIYKVDVDDFIDQIQLKGFEPYFIETGGKTLDSTSIYDVLLTSSQAEKLPLFVFGSESNGIPLELLNTKPENIYTIEQFGVLRSLNVSATVSIVSHLYSNAIKATRGCMRYEKEFGKNW